ncbi:hypothetical protein KC19_VG133100 [Ceratodon purpureus]|uniref:Uncharacterized protein n=1 Tax=Ceratodon purpureus TaxID=3225 RepID=A0A8T0HPX7_CERPU|nr:hypothetical protein KC19_VG133100 [Ceratodon purpureus]
MKAGSTRLEEYYSAAFWIIATIQHRATKTRLTSLNAKTQSQILLPPLAAHQREHSESPPNRMSQSWWMRGRRRRRCNCRRRMSKHMTTDRIHGCHLNCRLRPCRHPRGLDCLEKFHGGSWSPDNDHNTPRKERRTHLPTPKLLGS